MHVLYGGQGRVGGGQRASWMVDDKYVRTLKLRVNVCKSLQIVRYVFRINDTHELFC